MSNELIEMVADLVRFNKDPLAIAEEAIALIRNETLEEAAKVAEKTFGEGYHVAAVIRAMKGRPWKCPIKHPGCTSNCGSYGCGN